MVESATLTYFDYFIQYGVFAVLFVTTLLYLAKQNEKVQARQLLREDEYLKIIGNFTLAIDKNTDAINKLIK